MKIYTKSGSRLGSTFVVVIGVLAIIIFTAAMFMTSTIEEGRQTSMSIRGLHATSLAEASLERAMRIFAENINKVEPDKAKSDDLGILLRLPCKEGSSTLGQGGNLGSDKELGLSEACKKEIVLNKDALQDNDKMLDELVKYMTDGGAKTYEVNVRAKVTQAFRNSPGQRYPEFKVPGVDIGWNTRWDVKKFLNGEGYTAFDLEFPDKMSWLNISIPIEVLGFKIADINVVSVIDKIVGKNIPIAGENRTFKEITSLDFLADILLNKIIGKGQKKLYPINIPFDKIKIPKSVAELWPSGVSVNEENGQYLEKYGQISLACEAKITYHDNYTATRRVTAVKDFKVADCEPPAPMYSFFINNMQNDRIVFNNYGGQFYVNNYDYSGFLSKIKEMFTGNSSVGSDEFEGREFPGLIRVNYLDKTGGKEPILCNVGMLGDWNGTTVVDDNGNQMGKGRSIVNGMEALMIISSKQDLAAVKSSFNVQTSVNVKDPETGESVPLNLKEASKNAKTGAAESPLVGKGFADCSTSTKFTPGVKTASSKDMLKSLMGVQDGVSSLNLIPNVGKLSTNVIALAITLALKPLVGAVAGDAVDVPDCFQKWEMPFMGTSNSIYTLPNTGTGVNKTHLFGYSGLHPTMTKEIEGNVMKVYRQWAMCIVGMKASDRLPLLPFPPVYIPPPPIIIPIWKSSQIVDKYGYKLFTLKSHGDNGDVDNKANAYDPDKLENMAPNLYTSEQYAKKATYYYEDEKAFVEDLPNRTTEVNGKTAFVLNGITYIAGSLGEANRPFTVSGDTLYVVGKGMIVCSGNTYLGCNVEVLDASAGERTVFSWICRNGGLLIMQGGANLRFEGSLYTEFGLYVSPSSSFRIAGNWVTNSFSKATMGGMVVVDYVSSRVRTSLGSLHPTRGKYDPRRYHVSFSPIWAAWRAH